jgi:sec-independent protein translocase protein TatA
MSMPGPFEFLIIFFVVLLLFGAKRLPEIGNSLGKSLREFKKAFQGPDSEDEDKKGKPKNQG